MELKGKLCYNEESRRTRGKKGRMYRCMQSYVPKQETDKTSKKQGQCLSGWVASSHETSPGKSTLGTVRLLTLAPTAENCDRLMIDSKKASGKRSQATRDMELSRIN